MNLLCVLLTYFIESWILPAFSYEFNVVFVQRGKSQYLLYYNIIWSIKYTLSRTKIKEIIKIHFCLSFSPLYLYIRSCKFVAVNTRLRHSTWWERDELINLSKYLGQVENSHRCSITKAVLKKFLIFTGKCLCWSLFLIKNF